MGSCLKKNCLAHHAHCFVCSFAGCTEVTVRYRERIQKLDKDISLIEQEEIEEKTLRAAEIQVNKAQNQVEKKAEELGRPGRTWFQTHKERVQEKG